jgi:hypothetical protein
MRKKILAVKPAWTRPIWIPMGRREDHIKINVKDILFEDVDWIHMAQNRDR